MNDDTISATPSSQMRIDSLFKSAEAESTSDIASMFSVLHTKLDKIASQEYIEREFKKLITQDILMEKLDVLKEEIKVNIKQEIKAVYEAVEKVKARMDKNESVTAELEGSMFQMQHDMEKMQRDNTKLMDENRRLHEKVKQVDYRVNVQSDELNNLEQYTRRNSIRIYGLDDPDRKEPYHVTEKKVTKVLNSALGMHITSQDIDIAHRLGRFNESGNRPVICKFVSRTRKIQAITLRRKLKGTAIVIREDLTSKNVKLLQSVSALDQVKSAWSVEGRILTELHNGNIVSVTHQTDLSKPLHP